MKQINDLLHRRERTRLLLWGEYRRLNRAMGELRALVASLPDPEPPQKVRWWVRLWGAR